MRIQGSNKSAKTQANQLVAAMRGLVANQGPGGAEADTLLKEFSDVMDKIAAKLKDSGIRQNTNPFNDFGVGEATQVAQAAAPVVPVVRETKVSSPERSENEGASSSSNERSVEVTDSTSPVSAPKTSGKKDASDQKVAADGSESQAASKPQIGKPAEGNTVEVSENAAQEQAALPVDPKVQAGVPKADAKSHGDEAATSHDSTQSDFEEQVGATSAAKEAPVATSQEKLPETTVPVATQDSQSAEIQALMAQVQAKLSASFSAEASRIQSSVARIPVSMERETIAGITGKSQAIEQSSSKIAADSKQVGGVQGSNVSGAFGKSDAVRGEAPRAAKALSQVSSARTMEKVESALKEAAKSRDGKTISLRLDPPELGSVKVDVTIRDSHLHARVVAESPSVGQMLREKAQELQSSLRKLGLHVDSITVSVGSDQSAGQQNQSSFEGGKQQSTNFGGELFKGFAGPAGAEVSRQVDDHWVA